MSDGGTGSELSLGIILLALGLLALVGGLTTAEVMRRRAPGRWFTGQSGGSRQRPPGAGTGQGV